jgi:hypothetical protein
MKPYAISTCRVALDSDNEGRSGEAMQKRALRGIETVVEKALAIASDGEPKFPVGLMKGILHTGSNR